MLPRNLGEGIRAMREPPKVWFDGKVYKVLVNGVVSWSQATLTPAQVESLKVRIRGRTTYYSAFPCGECGGSTFYAVPVLDAFRMGRLKCKCCEWKRHNLYYGIVSRAHDIRKETKHGRIMRQVRKALRGWK